MIDWNPISKRLQYVLALKPTTMARLYANASDTSALDHRLRDVELQFLANVKDREHVEIGLQRAIAMQSICKHLGTYGGSLLVGDYAHWGEREDTFRVSSFVSSRKETIDPFSRPFVKTNWSIPCPIRAMSTFSAMLISKNCPHAACRSLTVTPIEFLQQFVDLLRCLLVQFFGPVAQGTFLYNLGLNDRLEVSVAVEFSLVLLAIF